LRRIRSRKGSKKSGQEGAAPEFPDSDELRDLGFGSRVTQRSRLRLLNRDGSFNVAREGLSSLQSLHIYHSLLTMPWWRFHLTISGAYVSVNLLFALAYIGAGHTIGGQQWVSSVHAYRNAFFFSVQTFTTIGYGHLTPYGLAGNLIATVEAFVGLIGVAMATGLVFARFARPTTKLIFSKHAVVAPYRDGTAFQFRFANARSNELVDVTVRVLYSERGQSKGPHGRTFQQLKLERSHVTFLPLHLTVVHAINEDSPLHGKSKSDLERSEAEFLVLITAFDETFAQTVNTRTSFRCDEIEWGARFTDMFDYPDTGVIAVDLRKLHDIEEVEPGNPEG